MGILEGQMNYLEQKIYSENNSSERLAATDSRYDEFAKIMEFHWDVIAGNIHDAHNTAERVVLLRHAMEQVKIQWDEWISKHPENYPIFYFMRRG